MYRKVWWTHMSEHVLRILDAQAVSPLSTGGGLAKDWEATN